MNRIGKLMVLALGLWAGAANAATATSNEARLDFRRIKTAASTEQIQYSTEWLEGRYLRGVGNKLDGYRRFVVISIGGYTGPSLSWARVLLRISTDIPGFDYHDMAYPQTGGDLTFTDYNESVVFDHDIDEWNVNGESLVWVKIPTLTAGLKIKMGYGKSGSQKNSNPSATWNGYAGVWHMGANGAVEKDSTARGLHAIPYATGAAFVPRAGGVCGNSQTVGSQVPNYDSLSLGGVFTVSGWFRADAVEDSYAKLFYRNDSGWADGGWGVECKKSSTNLTVVGSSNSTCFGVTIPTLVNQWVYCAFVYNGESVTVYANGTQITAGTIVAAKDNGKALKIARERLTCDEVRLCKGAFSSNQIKFDYDTVNNKSFCTFSPSYYITDNSKAVVKVNPCLKTPPKYLVVDMSGGRSAARWPISYLDEVPSGGWTDEYKTEKLVLRYIPAGSFIMGERATDYPGAVNTNLHMVTLTKPFYIGVFECTQRQWELAMGNRPSAFSNETCYATRPVECVSYADVRGDNKGLLWPELRDVDGASFCGIIRQKTSVLGFDLPTEAQWEYACRGGTKTGLNSGKNVTDVDECVNASEVARYVGNSRVDIAGESETAKRNVDIQAGTMKVGSYLPNFYGLYDMHGNVWDMCVDSQQLVYTESIDPIGSPTNSPYHQIRGGCWFDAASMLVSGDHHVFKGVGHIKTIGFAHTGFRICLHDATVCLSPDSETVLVNAAGAGVADWTPTQVGTYQLTHEVQVDGTTVAPMESALFTVEGPELVVKANGELVSGVEVEVEKVGGGGQWNIYYSLDGSEPTAGSTKYEGPFALGESATVKAVAISAGGVSSEVVSKELALHPALAVEDVAARQRYPWNGKVDIGCEITGDATKKYSVTFAADDEVGHTNLAIKTVTLHSTPTTYTSSPSSEFVLPPGRYRFTWDAAADLPKGTKFGGVSVSIDAEPSPLADWKRVVTISTDGYAGSETLTDVPVLVRLSSAIEGFDYADFAAPDTGADMIFTDMEGTARYPYEIDEWHKDGESLVWVKLPELKKGTKFKLAYGRAGAGSGLSMYGREPDANAAKHEVWKDYAGVWHMNEDSGTAFDSTEHGLDALPSCGTNLLADASQMVVYVNGACGRARVNAKMNVKFGNYMYVPSYDALKLGRSFTISGWFYANVHEQHYPVLFCREQGAYFWSVLMGTDHATIAVHGGGEGSPWLSLTNINHSLDEGWSYISVVYDETNASMFQNGNVVANGAVLAVYDNGCPLIIGSTLRTTSGIDSFNGQYDEIRLRGGSLSADRIKADYDMIANRDFCTYGKVEGGAGK